MIDFQTYRTVNNLLKESVMGMHSLGVVSPQILGMSSNRPLTTESPMKLKLKGIPHGGDEGGPPAPMGDEMGGGMPGEMGPEGPGGEGEEGMDGMDDMGDEMGDEMGGEEPDIHAKIAELEAELEKLKAQIGDDEDADLDHDDDLGEPDMDGEDDMAGDDLGDEGEGGEKPELPFKKGKNAPFMKKECGEEMGKGGDGELVNKKAGPTFMMKKAKKMKGDVAVGKGKKCSDGKMCKKCDNKMDKKMDKKMKKNIKEENVKPSDYARPKTLDNSQAAWEQRVFNQIASSDVRKKHSNGMRAFTNEDLLLPPNPLEAVPPPGPGQVGFATHQPVGGDLGFTTEAISDIMQRLAKLEK
jgi:hypothetical protein